MKFNLSHAVITSALSLFVHQAIAAPLAYVPNEKDGTISVIDTSTDKVTHVLPKEGSLGKRIQAAAMDASGKNLYVVVRDDNAVARIDVASGNELSRVFIGDEPEGISISPDGKTLAACLEEDYAVSFLDLTTFKLKQTSKTQGKNPEHCVYSPDGKWLIASNEKSGDLDVFDTAKMQSVYLIKGSKHPRGLGFLPDGKAFYVANEAANQVEVISSGDWKVLERIKVGVRSNGVVVSPDGARVYVSNGGEASVSIIDTKSNKVIKTIKVGERPWNMALTPDGKKLYVANGRSNSISVVDTVKLEHHADIPVGSFPWGVVIH